MANKGKRLIDAELNHIRRLLKDGTSEAQIMLQLNLKKRTFQRHLKRIKEQDEEIWQKQVQQNKDEWQRLRLGPLEGFALDILNEMRESLETVRELRDGDETPEAVRLEAAKWATKFRVNIYYLLERGPTPMLKALNNDKQQIKQMEVRRAI